MDQVKDNPWFTEPEVVIWWLYNHITLEHSVLPSHIMG
jgi:hypothetical protein